jgi:parvulin-like peptidyl-prolyl isomerase
MKKRVMIIACQCLEPRRLVFLEGRLASSWICTPKPDPAVRKEMEPQIIEAANEMFKELYLPAEKEILAAQLNLYATKSKGYPVAPMVEQIGNRPIMITPNG